MNVKEKAVLSVSADGQPCVSQDTNANQLAFSIASETVKSKKKVKGFFLPNHIFDFDLIPSAFCVYSYLCRCKNAKDGNTCFPSYRTIAAACCISKRSVSNALRQLEALGLVKRQNRFQNKRQTSNLYFLPELNLPGECVTVADSRVSNLLGVTVHNACQEQNEPNNTNEEHPSFNNELAEILEYAELDSVTDPYMRETIESLITQMFFSEFITVDSAVISKEQIILTRSTLCEADH